MKLLPVARSIVDGASVAVVGSSSVILGQEHGEAIDSHDVVIRFNLGLPGRVGTPKSIGTKTTIWSRGRFFYPKLTPADCKLILWMKLTKLGKEELLMTCDDNASCPVETWPIKLAQECSEWAQCDPATGLRIVHWLKTYAKPECIDLYGFDCWDSTSHWNNRKNTPNHNPAAERAAFERLGFKL